MVDTDSFRETKQDVKLRRFENILERFTRLSTKRLCVTKFGKNILVSVRSLQSASVHLRAKLSDLRNLRSFAVCLPGVL